MGACWNSSHSSGVGLSLDNILDFGCLGNRGLVWLSVIETMGGNSDGGATGDGTCGSERSCDNDATGGDGCRVILGKGGMSRGRGMRSSKEGAAHLAGGNGILSIRWVTGIDIGRDGGSGMSSDVGDLFHGAGMIGVASLIGGDGVSDWGKSTLTRSGILFIGTGGSYCSIDEYCRRCDPQGTKGSGGDATWGGSMGGEWVSSWVNGDGSTSGSDGTLGITGGSGITSLDDDSGSGMATVIGPPVPPEGPGLGMNTGDSDLFLMVLLCLLRRVHNPSRNV